MGQMGLGVMLDILAGGSPHGSKEYEGLKIVDANFEDDALFISFENGKKIKITDEGQSCCEHRYMTTDDDAKSIIGQTLVGIDVKQGPEGKKSECDEEHETAFIEIVTNLAGSFS